MASSARGLHNCRRLILVLLTLVFVWPVLPSQGQEAPPAPPPAAPGGPGGAPPAAPAGPEAAPVPVPPLQIPTVPPPGAPVGPQGGPIQPLPIPLPPYGPGALPPVGPEAPTGQPPLRALPYAPALIPISDFTAETFVTIDEEFTDNANETKDNRKSEFRTTVAPGIAAHLLRPQVSLDFAYVPRFFYPSRLDDSTFDHNLSLRSGLKPTPFIQLSLFEDLVKSTDFKFQQNPASPRRGTAGFLSNEGTVGMAYVPPSGRLGLNYTNVYHQDNGAGAENSLTHNVRADGLLSNPRLTLAGGYTLTRGTFDISPSYWEHTVDGRITRVLTPSLSGTLSGLFTYHQPDFGFNFNVGRARLGATGSLGPFGIFIVEGGVGVFTLQNSSTEVKPSVLVSWSQQFRVFSVSATYQQDYQVGFQQLTNTGVTFTRSASLTLATTDLLFRNLTATATGGWVETEFKQTILTSIDQGVIKGNTEQTWTAGVEIRYNILRPLSLVVGYTAIIRTATQSIFGFVENRAHMGLTYQYQIF